MSGILWPPFTAESIASLALGEWNERNLPPQPESLRVAICAIAALEERGFTPRSMSVCSCGGVYIEVADDALLEVSHDGIFSGDSYDLASRPSLRAAIADVARRMKKRQRDERRRETYGGRRR